MSSEDFPLFCVLLFHTAFLMTGIFSLTYKNSLMKRIYSSHLRLAPYTADRASRRRRKYVEWTIGYSAHRLFVTELNFPYARNQDICYIVYEV